MLYYDRIDVSEGLGVYEASKSKKCIICLNLYFFKQRV